MTSDAVTIVRELDARLRAFAAARPRHVDGDGLPRDWHAHVVQRDVFVDACASLRRGPHALSLTLLVGAVAATLRAGRVAQWPAAVGLYAKFHQTPGECMARLVAADARTALLPLVDEQTLRAWAPSLLAVAPTQAHALLERVRASDASTRALADEALALHRSFTVSACAADAPAASPRSYGPADGARARAASPPR